MDRASALDPCVDADVDLVVLGGRAQDARITRQVPLSKRRHHTAPAGPGDAQENRITDSDRMANPMGQKCQ